MALRCNLCGRRGLRAALERLDKEIVVPGPYAEWKVIASIVQSLTTSLALIVGGIWAYFRFESNRFGYPKLVISISPQRTELPGKMQLISVSVTVENVGETRYWSNRAELRLRQIAPLLPSIAARLKEPYDPVDTETKLITWPTVFLRKWEWGQATFEVEPGETETLYSDFVVDETITVFQLYFFLENSPKGEIGWRCIKVCDVKTMGET